MTDHVSGEGSYIECDWFSVVHENVIEDIYPDDWENNSLCYCGEEAEYIARVGFHTDTTEETSGEWPSSFTQDVKAHRCEDHRFDPEDKT